LIVVDVGTGSGCIACSIKKNRPEAEVMASDNSPATLSVVKYNANKLSTGIEVIHSNLFDKKLSSAIARKISSKESVALFVIANLPYLPHSDMGTMQKDVILYEPKNALFADDDGMELIKKCIQQLKKFLTPYSIAKLSWYLYFEIDPRQVKYLKRFMRENFTNTKVKFEKDLCGKERFMISVRRV
jgi:release factor glutamine methyltransferase